MKLNSYRIFIVKGNFNKNTMCDRLTKMGLVDVDMDGYEDVTGKVSSGTVEGVEYLYHSELLVGAQPDPSKKCVLNIGMQAHISGSPCWKCAKTIYLKQRIVIK